MNLGLLLEIMEKNKKIKYNAKIYLVKLFYHFFYNAGSIEEQIDPRVRDTSGKRRRILGYFEYKDGLPRIVLKYGLPLYKKKITLLHEILHYAIAELYYQDKICFLDEEQFIEDEAEKLLDFVGVNEFLSFILELTDKPEPIKKKIKSNQKKELRRPI